MKQMKLTSERYREYFLNSSVIIIHSMVLAFLPISYINPEVTVNTHRNNDAMDILLSVCLWET